MNNEFYTVEEVSKILKVHKNTVRSAIKKGRIQAFRAGYGTRSHYRISKDEISRIQIMDFETTMKNIISYHTE